MAQYYGLYFAKIQANKSITRHQSHFIHDTAYSTYVYVPNGITMLKGKIIEAEDYKVSTMDKYWAIDYTQLSKRTRAAFTAMHKIMPFQDPPPNVRAYTLNKTVTAGYIGWNDKHKVVNRVLSTDKPSGHDIQFIRDTLEIYNKKTNMRTLLQNLVNDLKYEKANQAGQLTTKLVSNTSR